MSQLLMVLLPIFMINLYFINIYSINITKPYMKGNKKMTYLFIFITLLLTNCFCTISFIGSNGSEDSLKCLMQLGYLDEVFTYGRYNYNSDSMIYNVDPQRIFNVTKNKPFVIIYIYEIIYDNSPDLEALKYAKMLQNVPSKMFFLANQARDMKCSYLSQFAKTLQRNIKVPVGIADYFQNWDFIFGNKNACSDQFAAFPLLQNYYTQADQQEFTPFSSWSTCDLKFLNGSQKVKCGSTITEIVVCNKKVPYLQVNNQIYQNKKLV